MSSIRETMRANPRGTECSGCGRPVPALADVVASVCWRCTHQAAESVGEDAIEQSGRTCPDCGGPMPARMRRCPGCARRRRLKMARDRVRRHRQVLAGQV